MADYADVRQRIISTVFSRRNPSGGLDETYVAHVKIWEDTGPGPQDRKPRYILLSETSNGTGLVHKSKENSTGSFSIGKTWNLAEVRAIQVPSPTIMNITISRTYTWHSENILEQATFIDALVRLFRRVTGGGASLYLDGFQDPSNSHQQVPTPEPSLSQSRSRPPPPRLEPAPSATPARVREQTPPRIQPPQPNSQADTIRPRQPFRPPEPVSASASTSSYIPSLSLSQPPRISTPEERTLIDNIRERSVSRPSLESNSNRSYSPQPKPALAPAGPRPRPDSPAVSSTSREPSNRSRVMPASENPQHRRGEHNDRVSFFDPANQMVLDRLISGTSSGAPNEGELEEESAQATMADVEEMLDGYELTNEDMAGRRVSRGAVDLIEARLLDELLAAEKANIYSFLESDDRIGTVLKHLDEAISELDNMDGLVSSYKIHLNAVNEDITHIQSQHRGLQVQTQNQRTLLAELENLLKTVHVDQDYLRILTQEPLEKTTSVQRLEEAAAQLYKALQAGRDTDMAATMEMLNEYKTHNTQFCKRLFDFLSAAFVTQTKMLLGDNDGVIKSDGRGRPSIADHEAIEIYLGRYAGLMLYLKEMDESLYAKLCAAYFSAMSELHRKQMKKLLATYSTTVKKASEDDQELGFNTTPTSATFKGVSGIRRAGTLIKSSNETRDTPKDRNDDKASRASEVFELVLEQVAPPIYREDEFSTRLFRISDDAYFFADYMGLDNYFRRQAARGKGLSQTTVKLVRGAMDLIFGFFPTELKAWLDGALAQDSMEVIGMIASLERSMMDADERGNIFLQGVLDKQHTRLKARFDRHVNERIKAIEKNKLTSKKRQGAASFVKAFPIYVGRVESQLLGADGLEIRASVDLAYEKMVNTMFDCLKQMAKMDGEGDDKGQLNYHVILIENMHQFLADASELEIGSMRTFLKQAEVIYEENLAAYVKIVLRRPFAKILDYFDGVERLLKTTSPTGVASNRDFTATALKRVVKDYSAKDIRKHVEALAKRVEKHFIEATEKETTQRSGARGNVVAGVWKACGLETVRMTESFSNRISQCYGQSGVSLDYTVADVQTAFRSNRVGT